MKFVSALFLLPLFLFASILCSCKKEQGEIKSLNITYKSQTGVIEGSTREIDIYPNPFCNQIYISNFKVGSEILVTNSEGSTSKINNIDGDRILIDFSDCSRGIYYLEIVSDGVIYRNQIIKDCE
jgi:hypothetical protein